MCRCDVDSIPSCNMWYIGIWVLDGFGIIASAEQRSGRQAESSTGGSFLPAKGLHIRGIFDRQLRYHRR